VRQGIALLNRTGEVVSANRKTTAASHCENISTNGHSRPADYVRQMLGTGVFAV
jgi:cytochrome c